MKVVPVGCYHNKASLSTTKCLNDAVQKKLSQPRHSDKGMVAKREANKRLLYVSVNICNLYVLTVVLVSVSFLFRWIKQTSM